MCGLFGAITPSKIELTPEQAELRKRIVSSLALAMEERGNQSAGVAVFVGEKCHLFKKAVSATEFIKLPEYDIALALSPNIIIGHTRLKTHGEINDQNAHPFEVGNIVGAHNGTLYNYKEIYAKAEVDSEAIFYQLDKDKNDYSRSFPKLYGKMALSWADKTNPGTIFLVRHNDAPLFLVDVPEINSYIWCSTEGALKSVLLASLGKIVHEPHSINENEVIKLKANKHTFRIKKKSVSFKLYNYPAPTTPYNYGNDYGVNRRNTVGENYTWTLGDVSLFKTPSFAKKRKEALVTGCVHCEKPITTDEGFMFSPALNVVTHKWQCADQYAEESVKNKKQKPYFLSFTPFQHKQIKEEIWKEIFDRNRIRREKIDDEGVIEVAELFAEESNAVENKNHLQLQEPREKLFNIH